jgi:hypothetical protein
MARKSKAAQNRARNLPNKRNSYKTTIDEVPGENLPQNALPGLDNDNSDSEWEDGDDELVAKLQVLESEGLVEWDNEDVEDDEEEAAAEIQDDAALLLFIKTLQDAHDMVVAAEREKEASQKRKKLYTGDSLRTKQHWDAK